MKASRIRSERGFVAGWEIVIIGVAVTFTVLALITTAWASIDRHMTLDIAAHEYLRAYTSSINHDHGHENGLNAALYATQERGLNAHELQIIEPNGRDFGPCASVTVEVIVAAPVVDLPFFSGLGSRDLRVTQHGLVDPHRTSFPGSDYDSLGTICADY